MTSTGHDGRPGPTREQVPHVQTKREIEALLDRAGLRPRKRLGQHFLIDGNLMRRLVDEAEVQPSDTVLEVGAGTGGLTDLLASRAGRVIGVEVDRDLFPLLQDRFEGASHVHLLNVDILERKHRLAPDVVEALSAVQGDRPGAVKLVANLPYHVATPLLMNLLLDYPRTTRLVFTVQAEVGDRLLAKPEARDFGPLAILAQVLAQPTLIAHLPPHVFWPQPEVESVMIRMDVRSVPRIDRAELHCFADFVHGVFAHRRKTLRSALRYVVSDDARERIDGRFDATRRPETFACEEWLAMFHCASVG